VFCRWQKWVVVGALIVAVGAHWTLLQSAAWFGMTVKYSQGASLISALEKTFSGKHPCRLCHFVAEGKKAEKRQALQKVKTHPDFFLCLSAPLLFPPSLDLPPPSLSSLLPQVLAPPPTPPPIPS
jgi:hypothetical protein